MASKKPTRSSKSGSRTRQDAVALLKADHAEVRKLFARFGKLEQGDDDRIALIAQACAALTVHATLEEELFYPALRGAIDDNTLLDEAQVEHRVAKDLIGQLQDGGLDDALRDATFKVLGEYVAHHIDQEEGAIFRQLRRAELDLESLGDEMLARKQDLMAEQRPTAKPARGRGERARPSATAH